MNKKTLTHFSIRYGFLIIMVLLFIFFSITRPVFLTPSNLLSILLGLTIYAILALGETFPLIVNGMDLSIGAIASLSVMVSSYCMVILELKGYYAIIIKIFEKKVIIRAEMEGFEPSHRLPGLPHFECGPFSHLGTSPW